jgi:hypothetical protein
MAEDDTIEMVVARLDENVTKAVLPAIYRVEMALEKHLIEDAKNKTDFMLPMWNKYQQDLGATKQRNLGGVLTGYAINACIAAGAAWAAIKGLKGD